MDIQKKIYLEAILVSEYGCKVHEKYINTELCGICHELLVGELVIELDCGDTFCHECIISSLLMFNYNNCPACELPIKKIKGEKYIQENQNDIMNFFI